MAHYPGHFFMGVAALAAALAISALTVNRFVRRKLKLSAFLLAGYVLLNLALFLFQPAFSTDTMDELKSIEQLAFAAAVINLVVIALINPLGSDRVPDHFPTILQDAIVIGLLVFVATFVFHDKLLTTSAVGAVVVGFALQDTLGNAFAGLAIQSEKPFKVGHWIRVGDFEGRVAEVTWRATKLRTKTGNFVVLPNNVIAKEPITNYSQPVAPTRLQIEVGASYLSPPNEVKAAMLEAMAQSSKVLAAPAPDVMLVSFDASAITYRARFWVDDYEADEIARDQVRTAIYYAFGRRGIEIPWPIQVEYSRQWSEVDDPAARRKRREEMVAGVDLFASLTDVQREGLAGSTAMRVYGDGETIVRQGAPGQSMYVISSGAVVVLLEPDKTEVARIEKGGYFGEMSLLSGEPRSATVVARGDVVLLEIDAEQFRRLAAESPQAVERIGVAAITRRAELDQMRATTRGSAVAEVPATFITRMKKFLRIA
jgi:small-conductance mechanosensitive channel/CRP-like cAMP-binding protein